MSTLGRDANNIIETDGIFRLRLQFCLYNKRLRHFLSKRFKRRPNLIIHCVVKLCMLVNVIRPYLAALVPGKSC